MRHAYWQRRYHAALAAGEARAAAAAEPGSPWRFACGFTNSVDRIVTLGGEHLVTLTRQAGAAPAATSVGRPRTPAEFLTCLLPYVRSGQGGEIWIADPAVRDWIAGHFRGRAQAGGTGVRGANTLAGLGFSSILHVTNLAAEQAALINDSGRIMIPRAGGLAAPPAAVRPDDPVMEHFIFEFQAGLTVPLATETIVAPHANRVIVALDPVNFRHPIDRHYVDAVASPAHDIVWAVISGYSQVADAPMAAARIAETVAAIRRWRGKATPPRIHLELGAMPEPSLLAMVLERLAPWVDSIGLNADELAAIACLQGGAPPREIEETVSELTRLYRRLGVPRLRAHSQHYCLSLTAADPAREQDALLYGSLVAGTFARHGDFPSPANLRDTLANDGPGAAGLAAEETLVRAHGWANGVARGADHWRVFVPTVAVSHPATTIGLGDSFTAGVLAMM